MYNENYRVCLWRQMEYPTGPWNLHNYHAFSSSEIRLKSSTSTMFTPNMFLKLHVNKTDACSGSDMELEFEKFESIKLFSTVVNALRGYLYFHVWQSSHTSYYAIKKRSKQILLCIVLLILSKEY